MAKSEFRCNIEHAVRSVPNCARIVKADHVFVDRSKNGDRIKFAFKRCSKKEARDIETIVDDMYPDSEVRVESTYEMITERRKNVAAGTFFHNYYMGWYGVTIHVSHDKGIRL